MDFSSMNSSRLFEYVLLAATQSYGKDFCSFAAIHRKTSLLPLNSASAVFI